METIIGDHIRATIGIHYPIPYKAPNSFKGFLGGDSEFGLPGGN